MAEGGRWEFDAPTHAEDFMEFVNSKPDEDWFGMFPRINPVSIRNH